MTDALEVLSVALVAAGVIALMAALMGRQSALAHERAVAERWRREVALLQAERRGRLLIPAAALDGVRQFLISAAGMHPHGVWALYPSDIKSVAYLIHDLAAPTVPARAREELASIFNRYEGFRGHEPTFARALDLCEWLMRSGPDYALEHQTGPLAVSAATAGRPPAHPAGGGATILRFPKGC